MLVSDIAKTFNVLGWFSLTIVKTKILLQRLWELRVNWDSPIPQHIFDMWMQWRSELSILSDVQVPRFYLPKGTQIVSLQLHGFCNASKNAYDGDIYLRMVDISDQVHIALVISKSKVAPIKKLTISRLELCRAHLLSQLLHHVKEVYQFPLKDIYVWTDSTIVLSWLICNPRRFKIYVSN